MEDKKDFTKQHLLEIAKEISGMNHFIQLSTFNDEMTISQVVRFFNKQGRNFTKTMIQNYVRVEGYCPSLLTGDIIRKII